MCFKSLTAERICYNEPDLCRRCDNKAVCLTWNETNVIPRNLSVVTQELNVTYTGSLVELAPEMFDRLTKVERISLAGNINAVKTSTFSLLESLKSLTIINSQISQLPMELFHPTNSIESLRLGNNMLMAIPASLFATIPSLHTLALPFNPLIHWNCSTIGEEFRHLHKLRDLNLANMTVKQECASSIGYNFFEPIFKNVETLNLTQTNVFQGNRSIFKNFTWLQELDISLAGGVADGSCPECAEVLFWNMPPSLETLVMRRWRCDAFNDPTCILDSKIIAGLKELPNLRKLDTRFGDLLYGTELNGSVFSGFLKLTQLDIGWCRFSHVHEFAFNEVPKLEYLSLSGNPLGNQVIKLHKNASNSNLSSLALFRTGIYADYSEQYRPVDILKFSQLGKIDLGDNYLLIMPTLAEKSDPTASINLHTVWLDSNYLRNLDLNMRDNFGDHCDLLPNLRELSMTWNKLETLKSLCISLTHLYLTSNILGDSWEENEAELARLVNLQVLDISKNEILGISDVAFRQMADLREIHLFGNNITEQSSSTDMFRQNTKLELIDLRSNHFTFFSRNIIFHLTNLKYLLLQDNLLAILDSPFVDFVSQSNSLIKLGLVGNPFRCSCRQHYVQEFVQMTDIIPYAMDLTCSGPTKELRGLKVYSYERDTFYCDHQQNVIIAFSILISIMISALIAWPCYRYRWYVTHAKIVLLALISNIRTVKFEVKCEYDAIILYNQEVDYDWVINNLYNNIERHGDTASDNQVSCGFHSC